MLESRGLIAPANLRKSFANPLLACRNRSIATRTRCVSHDVIELL
jgi:hypothetical protein